MLSKPSRLLILLAAAILLSGSPVGSFAQSPANFSGTWISQDAGKNATHTTLTVIQTADSLQITSEWQGKRAVSSFPLNGSQGIYHTEAGAAGTGFARWKGNDLLIETLTTAPPINGRTMRFHEKQRWQLSKSGSVLKIHVDTDSPDMPADITSIAIQPYTETYQRSPPEPPGKPAS